MTSLGVYLLLVGVVCLALLLVGVLVVGEAGSMELKWQSVLGPPDLLVVNQVGSFYFSVCINGRRDLRAIMCIYGIWQA